jgi:hypothetical protein
MQANPQVALLVIDPQDSCRWIEVGGRVVEMTTDGAELHADKLARRYTDKQHFYGDIYPIARKCRETRVIVKRGPSKFLSMRFPDEQQTCGAPGIPLPARSIIRQKHQLAARSQTLSPLSTASDPPSI